MVSIELSAFEIPSTYYQISKSLGNNYFWFEWADPDGSTVGSPVTDIKTYYIVIPDGNYKNIDIQNVINDNIQSITEFQSNPRSIPQILIDRNSNKSYFFIQKATDVVNGYTGKNIVSTTTAVSGENNRTDISLNIYFNRMPNLDSSTDNASCSNNSSSNSELISELSDIDLQDSGILGNMGWILGYRNSNYENKSKENTVILSEGCYDGHGSRYLYIVINDFNKNFHNFCIPTYNESLGVTNVLARIATKALSSSNFIDGQIIQSNNLRYDKSFKKRSYFGPVDIKRLEVQIVDDMGRIIDLNNMDISLALNVVCIYD